jgi:hypothetical protein
MSPLPQRQHQLSKEYRRYILRQRYLLKVVKERTSIFKLAGKGVYTA